MRRFITFLFLAFVFTHTWAKKKSSKPNIVIIVADDLGYADIGCYGNKSIQTPNLDKLAKHGVRLTDFHTNGTVCSPTRSALMTGKYQQRTSVAEIVTVWNRDHGLDLKEITFAEQLKKAGYVTGMVGKWHLGYHKKFNPVNQGFDRFNGFVSGNIDYHGHRDQIGYMDWWTQDKLDNEEGYSTDLITKYAIEFINRNRDQPFLLYIPHEAPHYPYQGRNDQAFRLANNEMANLKQTKEEKTRIYKEMIEVMDEGIGEVMATLKRHKLDKNTIVFFFSDNGGASLATNTPYRSGKGNVYEGGHRVPCIVSWKGHLHRMKVDQTLMTMDIYPTITKLAEIENDHPIDGEDIMGVIKGESTINDRDLFWEWKNQTAMRRGDYKLVIIKDKKGKKSDDIELYNLNNDESEKTNIAEQEPALVAEMQLAVDNWKRSVHHRPQK
ncbi:sulfatase-like hydrolase/transferase [Prolixibacteraceae bacterium]|nr:sulfatase-like hydrolase/transferase [Prolixibacteraceae bacterium]